MFILKSLVPKLLACPAASFCFFLMDVGEAKLAVKLALCTTK